MSTNRLTIWSPPFERKGVSLLWRLITHDQRNPFGGGLYVLKNDKVIRRVFREGPDKEFDASLEDFSIKSSLELLVSQPKFVTWVKLLPMSPEVATGCSPATLEPCLELLRHFNVPSFWSYFCVIVSFKTNHSKKYSKFSQNCKQTPRVSRPLL